MRYQRALDRLELVPAKDGPRTLGIVDNMAITSLLQRDYDNDLLQFQRVLEGYEKVYGKDRHMTLYTAECVPIARGCVFAGREF